MDVTALLNENLSAVDQQKTIIDGALRLPTRSRTPWDAGGYSLPLNTSAAINSPPTQYARDIEDRDTEATPTSIPFTARPFLTTTTSPLHKLTDSRSSMSSFTSSLHSTSHSRYSSVSTLNSPKSLSISLSEQLMLSPKAVVEREDSSYFSLKNRQDFLPSRPLDTLAQIAEHHSQEDLNSSHSEQSSGTERRASEPQSTDTATKQWRPSHQRSFSSGGTSYQASLPSLNICTTIEAEQQGSAFGSHSGNGILKEPQFNDLARPSSPSDTLLIKRPSNASSHFDFKDTKMSVPFQSSHHLAGRSHKRAISAPNFAAMGILPNRSLMPHEPTPPGSNHPEYDSPPSAFHQSPPATPPPAVGALLMHGEPTCMYIDDCDTDSPQRKAISHIFGRNKMCTRMIPEHLWVHLCRKHYQRCRYRDQNKWAKVQCDLVQLQIRRIHDWSLENQNDPNGIRLVGWSLTMRKREKVRREKAALAKRKRDEDGDLEDNVEDRDPLDLEYNSVQTQVPDWLVKHCDQEFNTQGILAIFNRLHQEVLDGRVGPQFPDIELLPNLVTPEDMPKTKKTLGAGPKRAHQRSQSMITPSSHESRFRDHSQKRQRREDVTQDRGLHSLPVRQSVRRPIYASIHEEVEFGHGPQIVAPQPQFRQGDGNAMSSHVDAGQFAKRTRPVHQRSQSEYFSASQNYTRSPPGLFSSSHMPHQETSDYPQHDLQFGRRGSQQDYNYPQREPYYDPPRYRSYEPEYSQHESAFSHQRHSSTPAQSQYAISSQRPGGSSFSSREQDGFRRAEFREAQAVYGARY